MRRYLFILEIAVAVLAASMVIGVGISALLLGWHLDSAPQFRDDLRSLLLLTAVFAAVTASALAGAVGLHRRAHWHWAAHPLLLLSLFATYFLSIQILSQP